MIPVRCYACGKVIGNMWVPYQNMIHNKDLTPKEAMDRLGLKRYCCRRMIFTHVDFSDILLEYTNLDKAERLVEKND